MTGKADCSADLEKKLIGDGLGPDPASTAQEHSDRLQERFDRMRAMLRVGAPEPDVHSLETLEMLVRLLREGTPNRDTLRMIADYFSASLEKADDAASRYNDVHQPQVEAERARDKAIHARQDPTKSAEEVEELERASKSAQTRATEAGRLPSKSAWIDAVAQAHRVLGIQRTGGRPSKRPLRTAAVINAELRKQASDSDAEARTVLYESVWGHGAYEADTISTVRRSDDGLIRKSKDRYKTLRRQIETDRQQD